MSKLFWSILTAGLIVEQILIDLTYVPLAAWGLAFIIVFTKALANVYLGSLYSSMKSSLNFLHWFSGILHSTSFSIFNCLPNLTYISTLFIKEWKIWK